MSKRGNPEFEALVQAWENRESNPKLLCILINSSSDKLIDEVSEYVNADLRGWADENCHFEPEPPIPPEGTPPSPPDDGYVEIYCSICKKIGQHTTEQCPYKKIAKRIKKFQSRKTKPSIEWLSKKIQSPKTNKLEKEFYKEKRTEREKEIKLAEYQKKIAKLAKKKEVIRKTFGRLKKRLPYKKRPTGQAGKYKTLWGKLKSLKSQVKIGIKAIKEYKKAQSDEFWKKERSYSKAGTYFTNVSDDTKDYKWFRLTLGKYQKGKIDPDKFESMLIKRYFKSIRKKWYNR